MNTIPQNIQDSIDQIAELDHQIESIETQLKSHKLALVQYCTAANDQLKDPLDSYQFFTSNDKAVKVEFPGPSLSGVEEGSEKWTKLKGFLGNKLNTLMESKTKYCPRDGFRDLIKDHLGASTAKAVIRLVEKPSPPRVKVLSKPENPA